MNETQINKHIKVRSEALAKKLANEMFEEWKAEYLASMNLDVTFTPVGERRAPKAPREREVITQEKLDALPTSSRLKQVYNIIAKNPNIDRHQAQVQLSSILNKEVSAGTIAGRIGDLLYSGLIRVSGYHTGKFGKDIALYSITQ